jgi:hypothetical protein
MHMPWSATLQSDYKNRAQHGGVSGFLHAHAAVDIIRGLFFSVILWALLAVGLYMVYTMVVGA